ncbi:hypothetical protein DRQ50_13070 [bacterium]|nr:MAG: hypothetical protein DRQ50_13070 [bacterium]
MDTLVQALQQLARALVHYHMAIGGTDAHQLGQLGRLAVVFDAIVETVEHGGVLAAAHDQAPQECADHLGLADKHHFEE